MTHSSEDELVLLHYGEEAGASARVHLQACAACGERLRCLEETLALARAEEPPEPDAGFEARLWERLRPRLGRPERRLSAPFWSWAGAAGVAAVAALLVVAFLLGREFPAAPRSLPPEVRERVLLVAVGDHLERSRMVLLELANAPEAEPMDVSTERAFADQLVSANRLYRQAAVRAEEPALASLLEELERVLVELASGPQGLTPADIVELQRRIESRGLLFKVQVIESNLRERARGSFVPRGETS